LTTKRALPLLLLLLLMMMMTTAMAANHSTSPRDCEGAHGSRPHRDLPDRIDPGEW